MLGESKEIPSPPQEPSPRSPPPLQTEGFLEQKNKKPLAQTGRGSSSLGSE